MRTPLLSSLLFALCFSACTDHSGSFVAAPGGPDAPVNDPDSQSFQPGQPGGGALPGQNGGGSGGGNGTGGSGAGGSGSGAGGGGTGSNGENGGSHGGEPPPGGGGGQPVPEPSTLLLVGTGLAGVALLRRRRRSEPNPV